MKRFIVGLSFGLAILSGCEGGEKESPPAIELKWLELLTEGEQTSLFAGAVSIQCKEKNSAGEDSRRLSSKWGRARFELEKPFLLEQNAECDVVIDGNPFSIDGNLVDAETGALEMVVQVVARDMGVVMQAAKESQIGAEKYLDEYLQGNGDVLSPEDMVDLIGRVDSEIVQRNDETYTHLGFWVLQDWLSAYASRHVFTLNYDEYVDVMRGGDLGFELARIGQGHFRFEGGLKKFFQRPEIFGKGKTSHYRIMEFISEVRGSPVLEHESEKDFFDIALNYLKEENVSEDLEQADRVVEIAQFYWREKEIIEALLEYAERRTADAHFSVEHLRVLANGIGNADNVIYAKGSQGELDSVARLRERQRELFNIYVRERSRAGMFSFEDDLALKNLAKEFGL